MIIDNSFMEKDDYKMIFNTISNKVISSLTDNPDIVTSLKDFLSTDDISNVESFIEDLIKMPTADELFEKYKVLELYTILSGMSRDDNRIHKNRYNTIEKRTDRIKLSEMLKLVYELDCDNGYGLILDYHTPSQLELGSEKKFKDYLSAQLRKIGDFNTVIKKLLDYNKLFGIQKNTKKLRRYFFESIGGIVCPYCNFYDVPDDAENIDHNLPKSQFPLFAVSKFNLVPSCQVCNISHKKEKYRVFNPLDLSYEIDNKYHFEAIPHQIKSAEDTYDFSKYKVEIETKNCLIEDSIKILGLVELYDERERADVNRLLKILLGFKEDSTQLNNFKSQPSLIGEKSFLYDLLNISDEVYTEKKYFTEKKSKFRRDLIKFFDIEL